MSLIEFIAFIISMVALLLLSVRVRKEKKSAHNELEPYRNRGMEPSEKRHFKKLLQPSEVNFIEEEEELQEEEGELQEEVDEEQEEDEDFAVEEEQEVSINRPGYSDWESRSRFNDYQDEAAFEHRSWDPPPHENDGHLLDGEISSSGLVYGSSYAYRLHQPRAPRIKKRMGELYRSKDILIFHEIFSPPKALRRDWDHLDELFNQTLAKD